MRVSSFSSGSWAEAVKASPAMPIIAAAVMVMIFFILVSLWKIGRDRSPCIQIRARFDYAFPGRHERIYRARSGRAFVLPRRASFPKADGSRRDQAGAEILLPHVRGRGER